MNEKMIKKLPILRVIEEDTRGIEDVVAREHSAVIVLNDREIVTLLCSPLDLEYLAAGFLLSEGLINTRDDIIKIEVTGEEGKSVVRVETKEPGDIAEYTSAARLIASSGSRGASSGNRADTKSRAKVASRVEISSGQIFTLVEEFHRCSPVFTATGGVHSAALCSTDGILVFSDDVGRHNAIDRVFGECLLKDMATAERIMLTSGRVSSEILLKIARRKVPIIISVSAPTDVAVDLADSMGITLAGFVRGKKMNIYTHDWRIKRNGE